MVGPPVGRRYDYEECQKAENKLFSLTMALDCYHDQGAKLLV